MCKTIKTNLLAVIFAAIFSTANSQPASAPDDTLLALNALPWWHKTLPSPISSDLKTRQPTDKEAAVILKAKKLLKEKPAAAIVLLDGENIVFSETKQSISTDNYLFGYSIGKTVASMAVGKAICAGKIQLQTKASDLIPELKEKALGNATLHDLLRMSSGTTEGNLDSEVWSEIEQKQWRSGELNFVNLISSNRVSSSQKGAFNNYAPGEIFSYKSTDPLTVGIMISKAVDMPWSKWLQESVINPAGFSDPAIYGQDKFSNPQTPSGLRAKLNDWIRFAIWVQKSSKETGCFGDYVRASITPKINNNANPRRFGATFNTYGYYIWLNNTYAANSYWAVGFGGQRIGWSTNNNRILIVFSNLENWAVDSYLLFNDWSNIKQ